MNDAGVQCPYCYGWVEIDVAPDEAGVLYQDCDVCCRPLELLVSRDEDGELVVTLR